MSLRVVSRRLVRAAQRTGRERTVRWVLLIAALGCAEHHVVESRPVDAAVRDVSAADAPRLDMGADSGGCSIERAPPFRMSVAEAECLGLTRDDCAMCHLDPRGGFALFPDAPPPPPGIEPFAPERLRECLCGEGCDLSRVECTALPGCLGESPPETMYCDDLRICLNGATSEREAEAIAEVATRIECFRADSCDFLCMDGPGFFDDEVRAELCAVTRVAPSAEIGCAIFGP